MSKHEVIFQDYKSIMVVNRKGIRQLFTPFKVKCISQNINIPYSVTVYVDAVMQDNKFLILYFINNKWHPFEHFAILY
jgi:hypothetical protein